MSVSGLALQLGSWDMSRFRFFGHCDPLLPLDASSFLATLTYRYAIF